MGLSGQKGRTYEHQHPENDEEIMAEGKHCILWGCFDIVFCGWLLVALALGQMALMTIFKVHWQRGWWHLFHSQGVSLWFPVKEKVVSRELLYIWLTGVSLDLPFNDQPMRSALVAFVLRAKSESCHNSCSFEWSESDHLLGHEAV